MLLGWLFGEKNRQLLDNLHYVRDAPGDTHGTEELRPMMIPAMCRAKRGRQWGRPKIQREIVFSDFLNVYKNFRLRKQKFSKYKKLIFFKRVNP